MNCVPERILEPPDRKSRCQFCYEKKSVEFMREVGTRIICDSCAHEQARAAKEVTHECFFCGDEDVLYYSELGDIWICDDCHGEL